MEGVQDRTRFAQYAEALDVTTDSIMCVQNPAGESSWYVLYTLTPTADPAEWIWAARLEGDENGILVAARRAKLCTIEAFTHRMEAMVALALKANGLPQR